MKDTNHDKDAVDRLNMRTSEFLRSGKKWCILTNKGSGALIGKMLLVRVIENNKIDA